MTDTVVVTLFCVGKIKSKVLCFVQYKVGWRAAGSRTYNSWQELDSCSAFCSAPAAKLYKTTMGEQLH